MIFEIGKCYRHTTKEEIKIVGEVDTTMYGRTLVAESNENSNLLPIGKGESFAVNWIEISEQEWLKNFS